MYLRVGYSFTSVTPLGMCQSVCVSAGRIQIYICHPPWYVQCAPVTRRFVFAIGYFVGQLDTLWCNWILCGAIGYFVVQLDTLWCNWILCGEIGYFVVQLDTLWCNWILCGAIGYFVGQLDTLWCNWILCGAIGYFVVQLDTFCEFQNYLTSPQKITTSICDHVIRQPNVAETRGVWGGGAIGNFWTTPSLSPCVLP